MTFDRLMVLFSDPYFWHLERPEPPDQLRALYEALLDPSRPGGGWLGHPDPEAEQPQWLQGDAALAVLAQAHETWVRAHAAGASPREAYFAFVEHPLTLFLDRERLQALFGELLEAVPEAAADDGVAGVSLRDDWATVGDDLLWSPQLRILGYWPDANDVAPPAPARAPRTVHTAEGAARLLEDVLWNGIGHAFNGLRMQLGMGRAILLGGDFFPPVFYVAVPTEDCLPATPEAFLEEPRLAALSALTAHLMVTDDPLSHDLSGGFLEGSLLTLRREYTRRGISASDYLLVGWWRAGTERFGAREEREALFVADQLAYPDFYVIAPQQAMREARAQANARLALWNASLDEAASLAGSLQAVVGTARPADPLYGEAFRAVAHLRLALARLTPRMLRLADDVRFRKREWARVQETAAKLARRRLSFRMIGRVRPPAELVRSHSERTVYQDFAFELAHEVDRAEQVVSYAHGVSQHLQHIHDMQRRDEEGVQEGRSRRLTTVFGSLAILTAFPFLVGELNWSEWMREVRAGGHPFWLEQTYRFLDAIHAELLFVTSVASAVLIVVVVLSFLDVGRFERSKDRVFVRMRPIRKRLEETWACNQRARRADPPAVEKLDREACEHLATALEWLRGASRTRAVQRRPLLPLRPEAARIRRELEPLEERTATFVVGLDLFDDRPDALVLPRLTCLLHFKSTDILRQSPITTAEFEGVLSRWGFTDEDIDRLHSWGEERRGMPIRELEAELRELGVTAE